MIVGIQILQPIPSKSGFNRVTRLYIGGYKIVANFFGLSAKFLADNAKSGFTLTIWCWKLWIFIIYALLLRNFLVAIYALFRQFFLPEKWIPPIFLLLEDMQGTMEGLTGSPGISNCIRERWKDWPEKHESDLVEEDSSEHLDGRAFRRMWI